ncbi:YdeI/OmpD-associated family protein [Blastococcus sp. PRF04-17]|uniref:YdeI/OmpD-associated family protein n=1 Tax=Blastococcus sp. PRF04-17 TaxID=2933797 RepID=UPI001FF30017|nr:YdeI/OmpD-associated family protein [Blastococcus sp. PRF04-17]UOY00348.1 YdeI/OmpD-associated family protein [Blastococcus sp. PRF04-17]
MDFRATVVLGAKTATGIQVPDEIVEQLGAGKRPPVVVTIGGYTYRTTVAPMGGAFWIPLAAEHREAAGVAADQQVDVQLELDTAPREVTLPDDLAAALDDAARTHFDGLAPSHRKEWVRWVEEAKKPETRATRIDKTVQSLREGKKTR